MSEIKRTALLTGGMGGVGQEIAKKLHDHGIKVIITYSPSNKRFKDWQNQLKNSGYDFTCVEVDVSDYDSSANMAKSLFSSGEKIDIIINNAGITKDCTFRKMQKDTWNSVLRTNLDSVFNITHQFIDNMIINGWGRVINISSINGSKGQFGQTNYAAAKAGMVGFSKSLALELADKGITVNCISPGYQETDMVLAIPAEVRTKIISTIPMKRLGYPSEVAALVVYLCSESADYMTGANLHINGGQHMV
ncbi:acetoacetyl-CoA reductase [Acinetobacter gyllenbergii]|uniref:acetoacetyl-CoA reductase n=1 Tax=Acinetobacter gyllenbergii TaxID=134534 RepID=UPI003F549552